MQILSNRTAIVTGGTRGIGLAITCQLLKNGASVLICSRNKRELNETLKIHNNHNHRLFGITVDVSDEKDCRKLVKKGISCFGEIDILVNNAGILGPVGQFETNNFNEWKKTFDTNLFGMVYCSRLVIPLMKKAGGGKIINLAGAGIGGKKPFSYFSSYYVSKAAVCAFTETLAMELKDSNIQVNCISPGAVNTTFTESLISAGRDKAGIVAYTKAIKQKKTGGDSPELAAKMVLFLASRESGLISGKMLSAKWDKTENLKKITPNDNFLTLRRIDGVLYYEKD